MQKTLLNPTTTFFKKDNVYYLLVPGTKPVVVPNNVGLQWTEQINLEGNAILLRECPYMEVDFNIFLSGLALEGAMFEAQEGGLVPSF